MYNSNNKWQAWLFFLLNKLFFPHCHPLARSARIIRHWQSSWNHQEIYMQSRLRDNALYATRLQRERANCSAVHISRNMLLRRVRNVQHQQHISAANESRDGDTTHTWFETKGEPEYVCGFLCCRNAASERVHARLDDNSPVFNAEGHAE
jgi:hypothetical protein